MAVAVQELQVSSAAASTFVNLNTGDFTPNPSVGDLLIAFFNIPSGTGSTISIPSGWTALQDNTSATFNGQTHISYKIADSSDATGQSLQWSKSGGNAGMTLIMFRITGHRASNPVTVNSFNDDTSSGTSQTYGTVTPIHADSGILMIGAYSAANLSCSGYTLATSSPTFTEYFDTTVNGTLVTNFSHSVAFGTRPEVTATGAGTATTSGSALGMNSIVVIDAPQSISISDTVNCSEIVLGSMGIFIQDIITSTESVLNTISRLWTKLTRNVKTWTNQNKD